MELSSTMRRRHRLKTFNALPVCIMHSLNTQRRDYTLACVSLPCKVLGAAVTNFPIVPM